MPPRPITLSIVSAAPVVPAGIDHLLRDAGARVQVVELDGRRPVDVVLFDPTGHLDADVRRLEALAADPHIQHVVVFGAAWSKRAVREAERLGVRAFVPKTLPADELVEVLTQVAEGSRRAVARVRRTAPSPAWVGRDDGLTARESQVLTLCADGLSNQEIADSLFVNVETVKSHLKRAYHRLGVRNRAQATSYVHRATAAGPLHAVDWTPRPTPRDGSTATPVLEVAPEQLADRRRLMRLDGDRRAALRPLLADVVAGAPAFVERLIDRWSRLPETAPLIADDSVLSRLTEHQARYVEDLFGGAFDGTHAADVVRIGAQHHRLRVPPQWYLASCAHLICDHLPLVVDGTPAGIERLDVLVSSVLFDAALVLDAYELAVVAQVREEMQLPAANEPAVRTAPPPEPVERRAPPLATVARGPERAASRRAFLGIDEHVVAVLRELAPTIGEAMPAALDGFYALAGTDAAVAGFFEPGVIDRLRHGVARFWQETVTGDFDTAHAASRLRVGVLHEQIGLGPQWYLAGLAAQLSGLLRTLVAASADPVRDADALLRGAFFDATFVIDAYLEARAASLLQTGRFAGEVVAGLANGVAIVDGRDRIEFANDQFLELVGVSAGVLHRMPVDGALPVSGILDLVAAARGPGTGRATAMHVIGVRTLRLIALRLDGSGAGRGVLVAVVVDDISDVLRVGADVERESRRFEQVLDAVDAMAWEADADSLLVLAVSRAADGIVGRRHVDLLGRVSFRELVAEDDTERFLATSRATAGGARAALDHGIRHPDGAVRLVRTTMVGTSGVDGRPTVSGVTMPLDDRPAGQGPPGNAVRAGRGTRSPRR